MPQLFSALAVATTLALAACTPSGTDMTNDATTPPAAADQAGRAEYRRNPQPKQGYRITMTIADAPGPFTSMRALAHYDVVNKECLSPPKDNPGGLSAPVPIEALEIPMRSVGENEYAGTVYADYMLDEDYIGRGLCHWELTGFVVQMKATGADGETLFVPNIFGQELIQEEAETIYFNKISYPRLKSSALDEPIDTGESNRSRFGPSIRDEDLFTITLTPSKEATP